MIRFQQNKTEERKIREKKRRAMRGRGMEGAEISLRKRLSKLVRVKQLCKAKD